MFEWLMAESDDVRALPAIWGRCERHQVLVKRGQKCSACLMGSALKLRDETFEFSQSANAEESQAVSIPAKSADDKKP
jgi:hypothetical protein